MEQLLALVPKERVKVLTTPPPFPKPDISPPPSPPSITVVNLIDPNNGAESKTHMLVSERYDTVVFNRVNTYFKRFYTPSDPNLIATLDSVDIIFNSALENRFRQLEAKFDTQFSGMKEMKQEHQSEFHQEYLDRLLTSKNLHGSNSNPISAWHGTSTAKLDSIMWYGMLNLSTLDPG